MTESNEIKHSIGLSSDSKEKWVRHAITKLSKGYKLVVHKTRKVSNFDKGYGDLETCPHHAAVRLIREGYVVHLGEDDDDHDIYALKPDFNEQNLPKKKPVKKVVLKVIDDDDLDDDDLDDDDLDVDDLAAELDDDLEDELDDELDDNVIKDDADVDDLSGILEDED